MSARNRELMALVPVALLLTAGFAGLHRGEICALRWRDIDFEKRAIHTQ